ncbi:hypothetical protein Taro_001443 [Colocasia esculenta]|uniref:Uncharacterized protein n=1 Tax=Colocasia esculenta TaxID=4460 RepID=A0A843TEN8_COLES|nr:hypothetical protein [Colocasia esculenta]
MQYDFKIASNWACKRLSYWAQATYVSPPEKLLEPTPRPHSTLWIPGAGQEELGSVDECQIPPLWTLLPQLSKGQADR